MPDDICSVCKQPLKDKMVGTCLCYPGHGSWHVACDPHERPTFEELVSNPEKHRGVIEKSVEMASEEQRKIMNSNAQTLQSFVDYCKAHPEERFWQALRNWSEYDFILGRNGNDIIDLPLGVEDTFYKE